MSDFKYPLGLYPSPVDHRDYLLTSRIDYSTDLPPNYFNRRFGPILDQGTKPFCVAYATSALKTWQEFREKKTFIDFDEPDFYYKCKTIDGLPEGTAGTTLRAAMSIAKNLGMKEVRTNSRHKINTYWAVPVNVEDMKRALVQFGPLVGGIMWQDSWRNTEKYGILPKPDRPVGGHAILIYGYSTFGLHCRNSWGLDWGYRGRFVLPWGYLRTLGETWKTLDEIQLPS